MAGMGRIVLRILGGLVLSVLALPLIVYSFLFLYVKLWAVWAYPHNNSMATLSGFFYGICIGALASICCFILVFVWTGRKFPKPASQGS
jgi:hypothetical protein